MRRLRRTSLRNQFPFTAYFSGYFTSPATPSTHESQAQRRFPRFSAVDLPPWNREAIRERAGKEQGAYQATDAVPPGSVHTNREGSRVGIGALMLASWLDGEWGFGGRVGTGFDDGLLRSLAKKRPAEVKTPIANAALMDAPTRRRHIGSSRRSLRRYSIKASAVSTCCGIQRLRRSARTRRQRVSPQNRSAALLEAGIEDVIDQSLQRRNDVNRRASVLQRAIAELT